MIKAILWDNDGVLVDTERLFFSATRTILATVGFDLTPDLFTEFSLVRGNGLQDYMAENGYDTSNFQALREQRNLEYSRLLKDEIRLMPGIRSTLQALYGKYKMGIVTSSRRDHFDLIHRDTNILTYFEFVLTREDYLNSKPDPEPYRRGLERIGVLPEECIAVEDSARGLTAANSAGLFCLMLPNELSRPETYQGDYELITTASDIIGYLEQPAR